MTTTIAGVAGLGLWVSGGGGADGAESPEPGGVPDGTVPSVFAHTRASATELLRGMGLRVEYRDEISCDSDGRPIGTDPATGTGVGPGDTVTLLLAYQGATTDCFADLSERWRFVDFATGRGPAPNFADEVMLFVDGKHAATVPGAQAATGEWGAPSALTELRAAAAAVVRRDDEFHTPTLQTSEGTPPGEFCEIPRPAATGDREALILAIDATEDDPLDCPARVALYRTGERIDAVATWTARPLARTADWSSVPDVVGLPLADARDALTAGGFTAHVSKQEACSPRQGVVERFPTQPDLDADDLGDSDWSGVVTLVVEIPHTTRDCAGLDAAAAAFIRFARGGPPPAWAPQVQQLFGHALWDRITAARADDPAAWSFCSGVAPSDCELSALVVAGASQVETGESRDSYECEMVDRGGLPLELDPADQIVLFPTDPPGCAADWSVVLWIDAVGRITAVNLLVAQGKAGEAR